MRTSDNTAPAINVGRPVGQLALKFAPIGRSPIIARRNTRPRCATMVPRSNHSPLPSPFSVAITRIRGPRTREEKPAHEYISDENENAARTKTEAAAN